MDGLNFWEMLGSEIEKDKSKKLDEGAKGLYDLYQSFVKAGFPEEMAFELVRTMIETVFKTLGGDM